MEKQQQHRNLTADKRQIKDGLEQEQRQKQEQQPPRMNVEIADRGKHYDGAY
jgi:hypothetical protein